MTAPADRLEREAIDRPLGWLVAIGGCILILDQTLSRLPEFDNFAIWWTVGALAVAGSMVVLAVIGLVLPLPVLEVLWRSVPAVYVVLQGTWSMALAGSDPDQAVPWLWTLEPAVITLLMLVMRPVVAVVVGFSFSLVPALSGLLILGHLPRAVLVATPGQLGNVLYLVILVALRSTLCRLHAVEQRARFQRARQVRAAALLDQQVALQRIVHDEVLSVLTSAMLTSGPPPDALRGDARRAIAALEESVGQPAGGTGLVDAAHVAALLANDLRRIDPALELDSEAAGGQLPLRVVTGLSQAAVEALRNSVRHAGPAATRSVRIRVGGDGVEVRVRDDGVGFDPVLANQRLGIAGSIVGRMADLGGTALVDTAPGLGTEVVLAWSD